MFPYDEELEYSELIDIMEERVEEKGIEWLSKIKIDDQLIKQALFEYAPKASRSNKRKRSNRI